MKKVLLSSVLLFSVASEAQAQTAISCWPGVTGESILTYNYVDASGGLEPYEFAIYVPDDYACPGAGAPSPLIAMFHGGGQAMKDFIVKDFVLELQGHADDTETVLVALSSMADYDNWNHGVGVLQPGHDHVDVTRSLLRDIAGSNTTPGAMNIDRDNLHGIGFSNGGIFLQHLSVQVPNLFGAIAVIASVSGKYFTVCDPTAVGCVPASYDNIWGQTSLPPTTIPTEVDVMLVRGVLDAKFPESGGWSGLGQWTLATHSATDPSEYGLWESSIGCVSGPFQFYPTHTKRRCLGATDLRVDVVQLMQHELPVAAATGGYNGPIEVLEFLFSHPK